MTIRKVPLRIFPGSPLPRHSKGLRRGPLVRRVAVACGGMLIAAGFSCGQPGGRDVISRRDGPRPGVSEIEPGKGDLPEAAGQTIYVPAYSAIATADNSLPYHLAITLSVRNTDRDRPIILSVVKYHDQDGRLVRDFLKKPIRIAPMATMGFFVAEGDMTGGTAASFLVEWVAEEAVREPIAEAIMAGTTGNQGISFICPGRVVADRGR